MSDIYVGIREETEDGVPESDLRQHVCPSCGNVDILTGNAELDKDVKPILAGDKLDEGFDYYASGGGFTKFYYRYLPHKCTACGARFTAVKREKGHLNKEVIAWYALFTITVAAHIALSMLLIANGVPACFAPLALAVPLFMLYANIMIKIDDNTYDKDPGPDYICEHGLSDAAFRRLEAAYEEEEEEEDLDETFGSDDKKTVQDIYGTLTPEQRAVVHYFIGDAVKSVDEPKETEKEMELLKQQLQVQQTYIFQGLDSDGKPLIFPQPTIRPWDIRPF